MLEGIFLFTSYALYQTILWNFEFRFRMNIPIVFTFDKRILLGAAVAIKSLLACAKDTTSYNVFVFHPDIEDEDIKAFSELTKETRHTIEFIKTPPSRFRGLPKNNKSWTEIVYYRFLSSELLPQFDKVIYSDVDVLFKQDLEDLYKEDMSEYELAAVRAERNSADMIGHKYFPENKKEFVYWSGLLLINSAKMRANDTLNRIIETAKVFNSRLKFFDLDAMNLACDNIKALPFKYVTLEEIYESKNVENCHDWNFLKSVYTKEMLEDARDNPMIVHYAGVLGKPWHRKYPPQEWQEYANAIPSRLNRRTFRDLRKRFFSKA